jgi:hypothetical protein
MPAYRAARPVAMTQIVDPREREERQMIRKSHFLLALALAAAAIGVPVAQATVTSPYKYLGHPTVQAGVDRVATVAPLEAASTSSPQVAASTDFQWGDAGIGAGFALGIVLVGGACAGLLISRQNRLSSLPMRSQRSS